MLSKFNGCCENWYWSRIFYKEFWTARWFDRRPLTEELTHQFRWLNSLSWSAEPVHRCWCCRTRLTRFSTRLHLPLKLLILKRCTCFRLGLCLVVLAVLMLRNWADLKRDASDEEQPSKLRHTLEDAKNDKGDVSQFNISKQCFSMFFLCWASSNTSPTALKAKC